MSRVLIIEDELAIAELEKDYLELSDFEVVIEENGVKGCERALAEDFDIFVLDLMLPDMDGFEICRRIRQVKNTPILMVSAKKEDIDKIRGLGLGADDYITKPFSPSELVARVKAHLARYDRLVGSNQRPRAIPSRSVISRSTSRQDVYGSGARKHSLRPRSSNFWHFWQSIQIMSLASRNCSRRSGIWIRSETSRRSPFISRRSVKR